VRVGVVTIPEPNRRRPAMVNSSIPRNRITHGTQVLLLRFGSVPPTRLLPRVEGRPTPATHDMSSLVTPSSRHSPITSHDHTTIMQADAPPDRREHPPDPHISNRPLPTPHCTTPGNGVLTPSIPSAQLSGHVDSPSTSGSSHQNMTCIASRQDAYLSD